MFCFPVFTNRYLAFMYLFRVKESSVVRFFFFLYSRRDLGQVVETHPVAPLHVVDASRVLGIEALHDAEKSGFVLLRFRQKPAP